MAKPEWGTKRICQSCSSAFYDLQRDPIVCPKCEAVFDPEAILKSRKIKGVDDAEAPKKVAKEPEKILDDDEEEALIDTDDDELLEDASDLEDEDVGAVIEAGSESEEEI